MKNRERWFSGYYVVRCDRVNKEHGDWSETHIRFDFSSPEKDDVAFIKAMCLHRANKAGGYHSMVQKYTSESEVIVDSNDTEN
jgi:hypothetical protein